MKKIDYNSDNLEQYSTNQLKKITDYWLRQYLLKISKKKREKYFCPLKKKYYSENNIQVAHFIDRSHLNTRYDLDNVCLTSSDSNMFDSYKHSEGFRSKHHKDYANYLGDKKVKSLEKKSRLARILYKDDYIELIKKFRSEST